MMILCGLQVPTILALLFTRLGEHRDRANYCHRVLAALGALAVAYGAYCRFLFVFISLAYDVVLHAGGSRRVPAFFRFFFSTLPGFFFRRRGGRGRSRCA